MEAYRYEALDADGRTITGVVQADTARQARNQLRARGLLPATVDQVHARENARQAWARGLSSAELSLLTRQMATLLDSGLTMEQTLNALIEEAAEPLTREVLAGVKSEVTGGRSLAGALGTHEKSFPDFYRALVHGGEESGALPTVLQHLADYLDTRQALRQKTTLALIYPILVTIVAILIVTGLLIYVVPQVVQVFQQSRQSLPLLTRALIGLSDFLRATWPYLVAIIVGVSGGRAPGAAPPCLETPLAHAVAGPALAGIDDTQRQHLPLRQHAGHPGGGRCAAAGRADLRRPGDDQRGDARGRRAGDRAGARRHEPGPGAGRNARFPPLLVHLVASGEASGKLEQMLERAAHLETQALERRLAVFLTVLEPAMMLVMGGVVLMIVLAILLPIIEINQLVR